MNTPRGMPEEMVEAPDPEQDRELDAGGDKEGSEAARGEHHRVGADPVAGLHNGGLDRLVLAAHDFLAQHLAPGQEASGKGGEDH